MNAIEFEAQAHDGVVTIPEQYRDWGQKRVKVILIEQAESKAVPKETLMERLRRIQIDGPADFSENIDAYLTGEKSLE